MEISRQGDPIDLTTIDLDSGVANDDGTLFRSTGTSSTYNLSTQELLSGIYRLTIKMPDGLFYRALFVLE